MSAALLLLPDFLLIVGGALLKRVRGFEAPFWAGLERLVYFVLFPALLLTPRGTAMTAIRRSTADPPAKAWYRHPGLLAEYQVRVLGAGECGRYLLRNM